MKRAIKALLFRTMGEDRARQIADSVYRQRHRAALLLRSLPLRTELELRRYVHTPGLTDERRRMVREAKRTINAYDSMFTGDVGSYTYVALSAMDCIERALSAVGVREPKSILDLPSGSGRVLRYLACRFPNARLVASDLNKEDLEFCRKLLPKVDTVESATDFDTLELPGPFELIWCGSLATHVDAEAISALTRCFKRHLAPGGVLVLTTHGDELLRRIEHREYDYGLLDDQISYLGTSYRESGFAYVDYPWEEGYGASLTTPDWIRELIASIGGLSEAWFAKSAWADAQDVFAFSRERDIAEPSLTDSTESD